MNDTTKWIIGIIVLIIVAFGAYALWSRSASAPTAGSETGATNPPDTGTGTTGDQNPDTGTAAAGSSTGTTALIVTYSDSGFSPATLAVAIGQQVTFVNKSSGQMWVASDPHPTHQGYDGTTEQVHCAPGYAGSAPFDECAVANTFTFTFTKAGSFGYHNHFNSSAHGTIVVSSGTSTTN